MPLPGREYFTLDRLSKRWDIGKGRVRHYVETGRLTCTVWLKQSLAELGKFDRQQNGREVFQSKMQVWVKGFVGVTAEDCRWIFRDGKTRCSCFLSIKQPGYYLQLKCEEPDCLIKRKDLVVMYDEVERFERNYLIQQNFLMRCTERKPSLSLMPKTFEHSNDYQTVRIGDWQFRFGMVQAKVIQRLHEASKTDQPWVHGKILLDRAGSQCLQLKNLFRNKPDWRECIESDGRGYYRLNL